MQDQVLIKRYPNRRLYDTSASSYVKLDRVADLIRQGRIVKVIEAGSEEDITAYVLTQIMLEEAKKKNFLLPVSVLHLIIRYGDTLLGEFFEKYLQEAIKNFVSYKTFTDEQFRKWMELGFDLSEMTQKTVSEMPPLKPFFDFFSESKDKKSTSE